MRRWRPPSLLDTLARADLLGLLVLTVAACGPSSPPATPRSSPAPRPARATSPPPVPAAPAAPAETALTATRTGEDAALAGAISAVKKDRRVYPTVAFSHKVHSRPEILEKATCESCHALVLDGNRSRTSPDALCAPCHAKDTKLADYKQSAAAAGRPARTGSPPPIHRIHAAFACDKCHSNMLLSDKVGDFPLPPTSNTDPVCVQCHGKAVRFSHAVHVNVEGKVAAQCSICHLPTDQGVFFGTPGHTQCWSCHDINLLGLTAGCNLCHLAEVKEKKSFNIEDASRRHKEHPKQKCEDCHAPILTAQTLAELKAAREESSARSCARCHSESATPSPGSR